MIGQLRTVTTKHGFSIHLDRGPSPGVSHLDLGWVSLDKGDFVVITDWVRNGARILCKHGMCIGNDEIVIGMTRPVETLS